MIVNTNILSTERAFSIRYPVKNSRAFCSPNQLYTKTLKIRASEIHTADHMSASFTDTIALFLWNTQRSSASIIRTKALNPTQNQIVISIKNEISEMSIQIHVDIQGEMNISYVFYSISIITSFLLRGGKLRGGLYWADIISHFTLILSRVRREMRRFFFASTRLSVA